MNMKITHRVKNSNHKTCGFLVNNEYKHYYSILNNADLFENITVVNNDIIKSKKGSLKTISKKSVNKQIYGSICEKNPLVRDIQADLQFWKDYRNDLVLYLIGARQIGKTTELNKFAYKNYEQIIYINLAEPKVLKTFETAVLEDDISLGMIRYCRWMKLEEFENSKSTILIIDEIQESVNIYNSIRALHSSLKCDIAVTGSYLGKTLNSQYFKPAGSIWRLDMLPLSFSEFCNAFGCRDTLYAINIHGKDTTENYNKMYQLYSVYIQIGGYPSVVSEYKKTKNIDMCMLILEKLIQTFTEESASHFSSPKSKVIFENVYKQALRAIAYEKKGTSSKDIEKITTFVKESTKEHVSRDEVNSAISWLKYSNIIGSCDLYNQGKISELLNERRFYFMDCGIANCISRMTPIDNATIRGVLTENFAYTELYRLYQTNQVKGDKPCCSIYNNYELDFLIVDKHDKKYGIEIKTSDEDKPASLLIYLRDGKIDKGYLAGKTKGGIRKDIYSIPIYAVGCRFPYDI